MTYKIIKFLICFLWLLSFGSSAQSQSLNDQELIRELETKLLVTPSNLEMRWAYAAANYREGIRLGSKSHFKSAVNSYRTISQY